METLKVNGSTLVDIQAGKLTLDTMLSITRFLQGVSSIDPGKEYEVTIKQHREKRSDNANAYFWVLLNRISEKVNLPAVDLYQKYIKEGNVYRDWQLRKDQLPTFKHLWECQGIGWITEKIDYAENEDDVIIRAYYGSSTYNTKQMSRLINSAVQDAQALGIETRTPEEINSLLGMWKAQI